MKKIVVTLIVAAFALSAGAAFAAKSTCTVDGVEGTKVTMSCDKADFKAGDKVTVKAAKKLEGC